MFHVNFDTSADKFQNYYKDVSLRMKNKELDLLIVVNMFLTGFDSKQFERSMNELGQKLGRLGKELGEQFSSAFDSSASGKDEDDGGEDTFVCVTDDEN